MAAQKKSGGSGRLTASNLIWIKRIAAWGRSHPEKRKWAVCMLVTAIVWFYLVSAVKNGVKRYFRLHKRRLVAAGCMVIGMACFLIIARPMDGVRATGMPKAKVNRLIASSQRESAGAQNLEEITEKLSDSLQVLHTENEDCVAWLYVNGAGISYPVMQHEEDEDYYLNHDFNGVIHKNGCLILDNDSRLDEAGANLIIHGHHLKNGEMFTRLLQYADQAWGEANNIIELVTPEGLRTYQLYAAFYSKVYYEDEIVFKYYQYFGGMGETEEERKLAEANFNEFCKGIQQRKLYDTGVETRFGDEFITLSTCSYHTENGRFVVVAKRIYA